MHLELTDHLICPRCDGERGLILLIHDVEDGRIRRGWLGCPACRTDYRVEAGVADLRREREPGAPSAEAVPYGIEQLPLRMAALVGVAEGPAFVYASAALAAWVPAAAELVEGVEWVTAGASAAAQAERPGVSRLLFDPPRLPIASGRLRGATLVSPSEAELGEAARVLWPGSRIAAFESESWPDERLAELGLEPVARERGTWVARRAFG